MLLIGGKPEEQTEFKGESARIEGTVNLEAEKRPDVFYLLLLTLKEEMQNIVGERSDSNGLERTVGGLKVEVHNSVERLSVKVPPPALIIAYLTHGFLTVVDGKNMLCIFTSPCNLRFGNN